MQAQCEGMEDDTLSKWQSKGRVQTYSYQTKQTSSHKRLTRDKYRQYIMTKGIIHQEDITFINIQAPNLEAPKNMKQLLTDLKGEIDINTITVRDLNTPLTSMDRCNWPQVKHCTRLTQQIHTHTYIYTCTCICTYISIYTYICIYTYMYIYIYI